MEHEPCYIYTFASHENDQELCQMELRALFGQKSLNSESASSYIANKLKINPSRSPFISMRLDVMFSGDSLDEISFAVKALELGAATFKVQYIKHGDKISYDEQRTVERLVGMNITGKADMRSPGVTYGVLSSEGKWIFGQCHMAEAEWLKHKDKPQNYSTGLSTPVSRALANIAVPQPQVSRRLILVVEWEMC